MNSEKSKLFEIITESSFALVDLNLFLDTHPCNEEALKTYNDYKNIRKAALSEYEAKFGPLRAFNVHPCEKFSWISGPWPWEGGCK